MFKIIDFLYQLHGPEALKEFCAQQEAYEAGEPFTRTWLTVLEALARRGDTTRRDVIKAICKPGEADQSALGFWEAYCEIAEMHSQTLTTETDSDAASSYGLHPQDALSALGRIGGSVKSEAKAAAARANGRKGGRPRKKKQDE